MSLIPILGLTLRWTVSAVDTRTSAVFSFISSTNSAAVCLDTSVVRSLMDTLSWIHVRTAPDVRWAKVEMPRKVASRWKDKLYTVLSCSKCGCEWRGALVDKQCAIKFVR